MRNHYPLSMAIRHAFACLIAILLLVAAFNRVAAMEGENLVIIFDASGSMWGQVEGRHKIAIAKEVMTDLIKALPAGLNTGLVAYGHRRKGDCQDVEELAPLGPLRKESLIKMIEAINPKGKTPITHAIQITAEGLKAIENKTTLVLVSDGKETCEGDPCALVKTLKESGIQLVTHVIGFDVTDAERGELQCIADAGDGTYYTADTAKAFSMAAKTIIDQPAFKGSYLKILAMKNGKPYNAAIDIFPAGEDQYITHGLTPQEFKLLPGTYDIRAKDRGVPGEPTTWIRDVSIEPGQKLEQTLEFTDARLLVRALKNGKPFQATTDIFPTGDDQYIAYGLTPQEFNLVPGSYDIRVKDRSVPGEPTVWIRDIKLKPGQKETRRAEFSDGQLMVIALMNGQSVRVVVDIFPAGEDQYIAYGHTPMGFRLLPGLYDVRVKDRSVPQEPIVWVRNVEVKAGAKVKVEAKF